MLSETVTLERYYQPVPFDGYDVDYKRDDCEDRFEIISQNIDEIKGKSLIDIGCANGFFMFKFIQSGGKSAYGVECDKNIVDFVNETSKTHLMNIVCSDKLPERQRFDVGIYLDLHYHAKESDQYLDYLADNCSLVFASTSGQPDGNNKKNENFKALLEDRFIDIVNIHQGFADRIIYKCKR